MPKDKMQIVGLGNADDDICVFSEVRATGYVDIGDGNCTPCNLKMLGSSTLGEEVEVPQAWQKKLNEMRRDAGLTFWI